MEQEIANKEAYHDSASVSVWSCINCDILVYLLLCCTVNCPLINWYDAFAKELVMQFKDFTA
jgi:Na+-translocating ferredoxin:NAD+ oxidoreductase RnfC subunit